ncbi:hypothetical protein HanRHA438_Chr06g0247481 [Helianthus annuus]|uniref:Uncharacterized protein n=1 Tax=Helianthus annuus TaxID=4232 RepID=A0A251UFC4_HELAN|nr:hypothetical protein HanXRQr2_Chr06g0238301 [Helianthus annuus]KAJ0558979.1 hypothetical protein HanHA300_Chr06g0195371 [Helianthus annuus]KAJ0564838.1 hypothetical protein HanIR_Chr06g0256061 [Helianthus annuus]KAJ0571919.1 hypothetical protein HanHA89_Chr06g0210171 [Helianthus annuus]KAJ0736385.1 hypothetical protein HanLR1_Chr06g0195441 [Helianthus annuus]
MTGICRSSILPLFHPTTENTQPHLLRFLLLSAHLLCLLYECIHLLLLSEKGEDWFSRVRGEIIKATERETA